MQVRRPGVVGGSELGILAELSLSFWINGQIPLPFSKENGEHLNEPTTIISPQQRIFHTTTNFSPNDTFQCKINDSESSVRYPVLCKSPQKVEINPTQGCKMCVPDLTEKRKPRSNYVAVILLDDLLSEISVSSPAPEIRRRPCVLLIER
jgi:hypothetical protein